MIMHFLFVAVSVWSLLAARVGLVYIFCVQLVVVVFWWVVLVCCRWRGCCTGVVGGFCASRYIFAWGCSSFLTPIGLYFLCILCGGLCGHVVC